MKEIRRENLRKLLSSPRFNGDREKFCQDAVITKGRLSQLLDEEQPFGDAAARNLLEKLGLPENYLNKKEFRLDGEAGSYKEEGETMEYTRGALEIAKLYDLIPETDLLRRVQAYNGATKAIVAVVEDHKQQATEPQPADQKTQPV